MGGAAPYPTDHYQLDKEQLFSKVRPLSPPLLQALIVADAYKQCIWTDWVNPLYRKVVVGGDFRYLHDFKSAFSLTPILFQQLASK